MSALEGKFGHHNITTAITQQRHTQADPPTSVMVDVLAEYNSWATNPSTEPLPEYRGWYIDRETLSQRGSFSADAIKLQTSINCRL